MNIRPASIFNFYHIGNIIRYAIGVAIGVVGLADMLSGIILKLNVDILLGTWMVDIHPSFHGLTVVIGSFLVMLSFGLIRGKRHAWRMAVLLLLTSAFLHVLRHSYVLASIVALTLIVLLIVCSRYFQARSDPPSLRRGYLVLLMGLVLVTFYTSGFLLLYNVFRTFLHHAGLHDVPSQFLTPAHLPLVAGMQTFFFERGLLLLCLSIVLFGMLQVLRPVATAMLSGEQERQAVSALTRDYGKSSISYFSLGEDKSYFFSTSGKSIISYVLAGNVAVVAGDPVGPEEEIASATRQFITFCQKQDWAPVFWQVRNDLADVYRTAGLHLLKIGEDAIIRTDTFTLKGGAMANVRSSAKRAEKEGIRVVFYRGQIENIEQLFQMQIISRAWLASKGGSEMGFSMGHFDLQPDDEQVSALAVDRTNRVHAFVTFVPIYGRHGWGLDLMRRAEKSAPGTMELLLACSIDYLRSDGAEMVSLGLAPLGNANSDDASFLDSSVEFLTHRFGNLRQSQSLFKFKQKFQPCWESRYLAFSHTLTLPKIGWALYAVHQRNTSLLTALYTSLRSWQKSRSIIQTKKAEQPVPVTHPGTGQLML